MTAAPGTIELRDLRKSFGSVEVIHGIDLTVRSGEFVVFVGPSGCGKSTLLRMIAGLEEVTDGEILIGGVDVTDADPAKRGIAMVFQSYALYPHMTVEENLAFGLSLTRMGRAEIKQRVDAAAGVLGINALLDRRPAELSGGQRQRVAIGRAIVREPEVFLFDEPLSNLDAELRGGMRVEIARLHRELGNTAVYVTHDQTEAMTLADRIVVLRDGRIEQVGTPVELYDDPNNIFVAGFIGSPSMNFVDAEWVTGGVRIGSATLRAELREALAPGSSVRVGLRPQDLRAERSDNGGLSVVVEMSEYLGGVQYLYTRLPDGSPLIIEHRGSERFERGARIDVVVNPANLRIFDSAGRRTR